MTSGELALAILEALQPDGSPSPKQWSVWPAFERIDAPALAHRLDATTAPTLMACLHEPGTALLLVPADMPEHVQRYVNREIQHQHEYLLGKRNAITGAIGDGIVRLESRRARLDVPFSVVEQLLKTTLLPCPWTLRSTASAGDPPMRLRLRLPSGKWTA